VDFWKIRDSENSSTRQLLVSGGQSTAGGGITKKNPGARVQDREDKVQDFVKNTCSTRN
jgi:hypothetical protein